MMFCWCDPLKSLIHVHKSCTRCPRPENGLSNCSSLFKLSSFEVVRRLRTYCNIALAHDQHSNTDTSKFPWGSRRKRKLLCKSLVHIPREPAISPSVAMTMTHWTPHSQRHLLWYLRHRRKLVKLESRSLNPQNPTTHSPNMLQIKLICNTTNNTTNPRNPNNESALWSWRNGSHIGTLTSRKCFSTMDEKGRR